MTQEKLAPMWQSVLVLIFMVSLIVGLGGYALYYKWHHPDRYEADIEHR